MSLPLRVALATTHPVGIIAVSELAQAWRRVGGSFVVPSAQKNADIVIRLSSLVRPSVVVHFSEPYIGEAARAADVLGLTIAAWDSLGTREPWRDLSAPLDTLPHLGRPQPNRPWALALEPTPTDGAQLHILGALPGRVDGEAVWWPRLSHVAAPLLGHASVVLAQETPLAYDAVRSGVALRGGGDGHDLPLGTLAGLIPPSLLQDPTLWEFVAEQARGLREGDHMPVPLFTPRWVAHGRDRIRACADAPPSSMALARRRLAKLRRDPVAFFSDSKHAPIRALGSADTVRRKVVKLRDDPKAFLMDSRFTALRVLGRMVG